MPQRVVDVSLMPQRVVVVFLLNEHFRSFSLTYTLVSDLGLEGRTLLQIPTRFGGVYLIF